MAKTTKHISKAILLDTEKFGKFINPFQVLYLIREANAPLKLQAKDLDNSELSSLKSSIPNSKMLPLNHFTDAHFDQVISDAQKKWNLSNKRLTESQFVQQIVNRHIRETFSLLQKLSVDKYHRVHIPDTNRFITQKCVLHEIKPSLDLSVKKVEEKFRLRLRIQIGADWLSSNDFLREGALIRKNQDWYLLNQQDLSMLDKLAAIPLEEYAYNEASFLENVLAKIEETHSVHKIDCFPSIIIEATPRKTVFLSEISGQFLKLTPQYNYDGWMVEGEFKPEKIIRIKGQEYKIIRDEAIESAFNAQIQALHPNFSKQFNNDYFLTFQEAKSKDWFLKVYHQLLEADCDILGMDMMQHFRYSEHPVATTSKLVKTEGVLLFFEIEVSFGNEKVALKDLKKALLADSSHVLLSDNSLGVLTAEWKSQYATVLKHGKLLNNLIEIPQWIIFANQEFAKSNAAFMQMNQAWWQKWQAWQTEEQCFPPPSLLKAQLRPYQQKGYEWMILLAQIQAGACLADDMGLGKTLQTIAFLAYLEEQKPQGKYLIVCPSSLIYNWKQEIEKFAPHLQTLIYHGLQRNFDQCMLSETQIIITGYATLRNDIDTMSIPFWDAVILDESHHIKNLYAKTSKAVYRLQAKSKLALSGTPILNNTFDLYSQMNFLLPDLLGGQEFFRNEYANPIDKSGSKAKMEALNKLTAPFILRRTKNQVAKDLPPKTESIMWCTMSQEQQDAYEYIKVRIRDSLFLSIKNEGFGGSKMGILAGITKLKQICASPSLVKDAEIVSHKSVKVERLLSELSSNLKDSKVLVFSQFNSLLNLLSEEMRAMGLSHFHLSGETPIEKRAEMIAQFQEDESPQKVFLLSLKAGNAGITLTAADYVFLMDPWWNTAVEQQAIDRTHRIGQDKHVFAYKMICKNSIEEKIIQLQAKKQHLSDELIKEEEGFVKQLTEEDVAFLLS
jgi:SNF2 family DNA or RNA helicase